MPPAPLDGTTIGITAERRAREQAELIAARGGHPVHGPTLRVASLADDETLQDATREVVARPPDYLIASTGFGMRTWLGAAEQWGLRDALVGTLSRARIANRGAKAASANRAAGLDEWWRAPDEQFGQVVERLLGERLEGRRVVVQLHGTGVPPELGRLRDAGAGVILVDAYRTMLPDDHSPAHRLVDAACAGELEAVTFTTAPAVHNLFVLAEERGRADDLRRAFNAGGVVAACVGPVCAEGAEEEGIEAPLVPGRSRLVPLIDALAAHLSSRPATP